MATMQAWSTIDGDELQAHLSQSFATLLGDGLNRPSHPAADYLSTLKLLGKTPIDANAEVCAAMAQALLDRVTWATYSPTELWSAYGGEPVRRLLQPRLADPDQYFDALAELRLCGQIRQVAGLRAEFEVRPGRPDLYLTDRGEKVWIEVKHLRPASRPERLDAIVNKAGKQFKSATNGSGAGALHVSVGAAREWLSEEDDPHRLLLDRLTRRILTSSRNRSVCQVVVSWDDYVVVVGDRGTFALVPRRRARMVQHPAPRAEAVIPDEYLSVGRVSPWITVPSNPTPIRANPGSFRPHRSLPSKLARHGLKWWLLTNALRDPVAIERFDVASTSVVLIVASVKRGFGEVFVLAGGVKDRETVEIRWVYPLPRVLRPDVSSRVYKQSPLGLMFNLVQEYGVQMRVDDQYAPMIVAAHFAGRDPDDGCHQVQIAGRTVFVDQLGSRKGTHVVFQHALDADRYLADLRSSGLMPPPR